MIPDSHKLSIESNYLASLESTKDFRVTVDSHLNFSKHIDEAVSKAKSRSYLILKSFKNINTQLMILTFKIHILPLLDYCSSIWSLYKLSDIDRI